MATAVCFAAEKEILLEDVTLNGTQNFMRVHLECTSIFIDVQFGGEVIGSVGFGSVGLAGSVGGVTGGT